MPDTSTDPSTEVSLCNGAGTTALVSTFGARLVELLTRDRTGTRSNVVLGFDSESEYRNRVNLYFGSTVGRVAGRIENSIFRGGGLEFALSPNEGDNHLHGGPRRAMDRVQWDISEIQGDHSVTMRYVSAHGEEGYPGVMTVDVTYELTADNDLIYTCTATTDRPCPVNLVNHTYWNLSGDATESIVGHEFKLLSSQILETDAGLLPTGRTTEVHETPYDFTSARTIGSDLPTKGTEPWPGIDSTYLLDDHTPMEVVARLKHAASGRLLEIATSEPTLQVYTGNRIPNLSGRSGAHYSAGSGICIEAQRIPDSPRLPWSPTTVIGPADEYRQVTVWRFRTD
jgi:aldose 1-epimerase